MTRSVWLLRKFVLPICSAVLLVALTIAGVRAADIDKAADKAAAPADDEKSPIDPIASQIRPGDWNQWGGSPVRDNTPDGQEYPDRLGCRQVRRSDRPWKKETARNINWAARLGSQSYGNPIVANGKVFIGTNNGSGYLKQLSAGTSIWASCFASTRPTANSFGRIRAKSSPPAASTIGRCKASARRRWSKGIGCGTSPAAAK